MSLSIKRQFERQGPLYVPRYDVDRPSPFERYKRRFRADSFVQGSDGTYGGSSPFVCSLSTCTSGNLLVAFYNGLASATPTIADTDGDSWTQLFDDTTYMSGYHNTLWYAFSNGGGNNPNNVTVSDTAVGGLGGVCAMELHCGNYLDAHPAPGAGTTTPALTTTAATAAGVAAWASNTPYSGGGSTFSYAAGVKFGSDYYAILCYALFTSIQTAQTYTPSGGSGGVAMIADWIQPPATTPKFGWYRQGNENPTDKISVVSY